MKYPYDIISYVRKKTFSIEARFTRKTDESPLQVFDDFARFKFNVIFDGKAVTCNIPLDILSGMKAASEYAMKEQMVRRYGAANKREEGETPASPAFTVQFKAGKLKGKTPVAILLENDEATAKKMLNDQYKWLKENLEKYPGNKELMDAIVDATKLDLAELKEKAPVTSSTSPVITILDIGARPLVRKTREDGKCFCYECKVTWDPSKNYPVSVSVSNYYAPVVQKENGLLNVQVSGKDRSTEMTGEFSMTDAEWLNAVDQMVLGKDGYQRMYLADAFKLADKADFENREAAKRNKAAS